MAEIRFRRARPIWLEGRSREMNVTAGFRAVFEAGRGAHVLRVTGATIYRIRLNGEFLGHGPARCGHGVYRVDEWALPVTEGENLLAIEVAGYNADSYAYLDQESFLQAEVEAGGKVLAWTGSEAFAAYALKERVQKVQRYSFQRTFVEAYVLSPRSSDWCSRPRFKRKPQAVEALARRRLAARGVPYPRFETRQPVCISASGTALRNEKADAPEEGWWTKRKDDLKLFPVKQHRVRLHHEIVGMTSSVESTDAANYDPSCSIELGASGFKVFDLGQNLTGFIGLHVSCEEDIDLYIAFDELATETGDVDFYRLQAVSAVRFSLKKGSYDLETIEPYTLRFLKVIAATGACRVSDVFVREYACPDARSGSFAASDPDLSDLFEAARQTFRQNSVDIFMDCPSRERAGWLCDSFFTARAERALCGGSQIERNFFENFLLPKKYPHLPDGMLPMCYPSDHTNGRFIPNWAMWFVIELEGYLARSGDRGLVDSLRDRVYGLVDYFAPFLNSDGLLEKLESWVFLEWSRANSFTQDVSYASNMVYAGMLDAAGRLYDDETLKAQAESVREAIRDQSFDGEYFVDNAKRLEDGTLEVTRNRTETCQYYAFFFDVAKPETHPDLWARLLREFGPDRDPETQHPEIHPSNAFIGFFLRLDILSRYGEASLVLDQLRKSYLPMAKKTLTLWEHKDTSASCNHGFASHVAHILYRDVLGVRIDPAGKVVEFRIPDLPLEWCEGRMPVEGGCVDASWRRRDGRTIHRLSVPRGYRTEVTDAGSS